FPVLPAGGLDATLTSTMPFTFEPSNGILTVIGISEAAAVAATGGTGGDTAGVAGAAVATGVAGTAVVTVDAESLRTSNSSIKNSWLAWPWSPILNWPHNVPASKTCLSLFKSVK